MTSVDVGFTCVGSAATSAAPDRQADKQWPDPALVSSLSRPLHSRAEFAGLTMATVSLTTPSAGGELNLVFAGDERRAAYFLTRSYDMIADLLRQSAQQRNGLRVVFPDRQSERTAFGYCLPSDYAPLAVFFWSDLKTGLLLLEFLVSTIDHSLKDFKVQRSSLSPREMEVISLSAAGKTSGEIASNFGIAETTVNAHVKNAMKKMKARSRTHLISIAIRNGYI
ncbi:MAG: LuxR C-terminal-related transcriptional regulator [Rhizobium sp.]|nr:LuxR C-terminal-related transcriptional regulator [Rhizobium sp.]